MFPVAWDVKTSCTSKVPSCLDPSAWSPGTEAKFHSLSFVAAMAEHPWTLQGVLLRLHRVRAPRVPGLRAARDFVQVFAGSRYLGKLCRAAISCHEEVTS